MTDKLLALHKRLHGGGNRIIWRSEDVRRIAAHMGGTMADPLVLSVRRDALSESVSMPAVLSAAEGAGTERTFTISTEGVDRMFDKIAIAGWRLSDYRRNPVVLFGHNGSMLPVARAIRTWVEDGRLRSTVKFSNDEMAKRVAAQVNEGVLKAASVGFSPGRWQFTKDEARPNGIDFLGDHTLLEWSIVAVPANPGCLIDSPLSEKTSDNARVRAQAKLNLIKMNEKHRQDDKRLAASAAWMAMTPAERARARAKLQAQLHRLRRPA